MDEGGWRDTKPSYCDLLPAQAVPGPAAPRRAEGPHVRGAPTSSSARQEPAQLRTQVRKGRDLNRK